MEPLFFLDGKFLPRSESHVPIENIGLNRAYGIFDFFRIRDGKPTFLKDHLHRFLTSQEFLALESEISEAELHQVVLELLDRNEFQEGTMKLLLLADQTGELTFRPMLSAIHLPYEKGSRPDTMNVITHEFVREHPHIKSLNYFTSFSLSKKMRLARAGEVVYHQGGVVSEASRSNIYIVKDGVVFTTESNILKGINRRHVMKAVAGLVSFEIKDFGLEELVSADEVFMTGTLKEVMPVLAIDDVPVGKGKVGPTTSKVQNIYDQYLLDWVS